MTETANRPPESADRLHRVHRTPMYVLDLYTYGVDQHADAPTTTLGPFTEYEARQVVATLSVPFRRRRIRREPPTWATT